jgi:hypothetical protein
MMIRVVSMTYVALCAALVFGLYHVKNKTLALEETGRDLDHKIERAGADIKLLEAEWATRSSPDYVAHLVATRLPALRPTAPRQLGSLETAPKRVPDFAPGEDSIARLLTDYEQAGSDGSPTSQRQPTL